MTERRCALVTGASSGIGAAITRALARDGWTLYVCARRADRLREVTAGNARAFSYVCDVSEEDSVAAFVDAVRGSVPHVDALVNCAAVIGPIGPTSETDSQEWHHTLQVNLGGTYLMIKHVLPLMGGSSKPRIINFAGGGAFSPFPNYSAYAASKAAVVGLTENLALELAPRGITVNAVAPGFVATGIHTATLHAGPALAGEEYARNTAQLLKEGSVPVEVPVACVRFLLSTAADGLTGKTISAAFDPWDTPEFAELSNEINGSDLYTQRRINLVNLPEGRLREALDAASARKGS